MAGIFKFTFGPWNIHEGADPFGPTVRKSVEFSKKLTLYKKLGFDVKAMRTQKDDVATKHLSNSREIFLKLLNISRKIDDKFIVKCQQERDYEELDLYIMKSLLGG